MTIYEIAKRVKNPDYFSKKTLKYYNQELADFKVIKMAGGQYFISAPSTFHGELVSFRSKIFNSKTNELEPSIIELANTPSYRQSIK